jgi:TolB protein
MSFTSRLRRLAAPVFAGLLLSGAVAQGNGGSAPDPLDPAGLVAFVDPDGRLAVVDPDTSDVTVYGGGLQRAQFPAWSSDGDRVAAVVADQTGGRVDVIDVAAGGEPATVYARAARGPIYLSWSPGDAYLAVLAGTGDGGLALDLVDVSPTAPSAGDAIRPFATGAPFYWTWSSDGRSLLVHRDVLRPTAVVGFTEVAAFDVRQPLPEPGAFQSPALSSSERFVGYARRDAQGGRTAVAVSNPERPEVSSPTRFLAIRGTAALAWRPGAEQLAVQHSEPPGALPHGPVDLLDAATGEVRRLSDDVVLASFWSPDGSFLATLSVVSVGGERTVQGFAPPTEPTLVAQTVQSRGVTLALKVVDAETTQARTLGLFTPSPAFFGQYLPFFDQYARSHQLWSPASDALVLPALDEDGVPTLVRFGLDGAIRPLTVGDMPAWNVR